MHFSVCWLVSTSSLTATPPWTASCQSPQALGGKVEKFSGGWSIGRVDYQLDLTEEAIPLYAWHQDQVVECPPDATVAGATDFCRYAALRYGDRAYTIQPHPEFSESFIRKLLVARRDVVPSEIAGSATASLDSGPTNSAAIASYFAEFFRNGAANRRRQQSQQHS